jgi:hypothetical protein
VTGSNHTIFGNVGIGITGSNAFGLDVNGTARVSGVAAFLNRVQVTGNAGPASGAGLELYYNGTVAGTVGYSRSAATYIPNSMDGSILQFYINSTERMRIAAGGNVGIGITDPSALLHISGSGSGSLMRISSHVSSSIFFVSGSGNIGIGTVTPTNRLEVIGVSGSSGIITPLYLRGWNATTSIGGTETSYGGIHLSNNVDTTAVLRLLGSGHIQLATDSSGRFISFATDAFAERMRIASGGSVGIGTTSPQQKLHVEGDVYLANNRNLYFANSGVAAGAIRFYNSTSSTTKSIIGSYLNIADEGNIEFANGASLTTKMIITSGGSVGIGTTSPDAIFHVAKANSAGLGGQIVIDNSAGSTVGNTVEISFLTDSGASGAGTRNARIQAVNENTGNGAANLQFWTWNGGSEAEKMRISSAGSVTKPLQPFVIGGLDGNQSISLNTFTTLNFSTSVGMFYYANVGNCWNNSTRAFTAPVTGTYLVNVSVLTNSIGQVALHVNGNRKHSIPSPPYTGSVTWGGSAMIPLSSGEVLTLQGYGNAGTVEQNTFHTFFAIYLLG